MIGDIWGKVGMSPIKLVKAVSQTHHVQYDKRPDRVTDKQYESYRHSRGVNRPRFDDGTEHWGQSIARQVSQGVAIGFPYPIREKNFVKEVRESVLYWAQ